MSRLPKRFATAGAPPPEDRIPVGKVVSVYGIKGWVKVYSYTDPRENLLDYGPHWLAPPAGQEDTEPAPVEIDEGRVQGQLLVVHLKGVDDREAARTYCQREILARREALPKLEEGQYYWHQLVGLRVYSSMGGNEGTPPVLLGVVKQMLETGANDVVVVSPCEGSVDKRERLLPWLPVRYRTDVDLQAGSLIMEWDPEF